MNRHVGWYRSIVFSWFAVSILTSVHPANAEIVTVLFTGFGSPVAGSGMEELNNRLAQHFAADFPTLTYAGRGFEYTQQQDAADYIQTFNNIEALFLVGHSFGGSSLIQLAANHLLPANISVDLTFQIDSVDNFLGSPPDNALPSNVLAGYNYYQISTGLFEPQGEQFVAGATNINVELLFNDATITHTSIDNDVRLHDTIYSNMRQSIVPEPSSWALMAIGVVGLLGYCWQSSRQRFRRHMAKQQICR